MKKALCVAFVLLCFVTLAAAQDVPKFEVFGGYGIQRLGYSDISAADLGGIFDYYGLVGIAEAKRFMYKGFVGSFTYNATDVFGIEAEFMYNSGDILNADFDVEGTMVSAKAKYSDFAFLVGPRFALRKSEAVTPFVHALVGFDRAELSVEASALGASESQDLGSDTGLGIALGGGLDVNVTPNFSIRVIQADYYLTNHYDENMNNLALAFGAVFRF